MSNDKESSAAGTDNRAPVLEENDYESWKIRMKRYIRSKPQGKAIWKSIMEAPAPHLMTAAVTGVANVSLRPAILSSLQWVLLALPLHPLAESVTA
nr:hypothetical protein [Tanacetum cinerariifolium]